jgi:hypothetical protein
MGACSLMMSATMPPRKPPIATVESASNIALNIELRGHL